MLPTKGSNVKLSRLFNTHAEAIEIADFDRGMFSQVTFRVSLVRAQGLV